VTLVDLRSSARLASFTGEAPFASFALSSDARLIALGDQAKRVHILWLMVPQEGSDA